MPRRSRPDAKKKTVHATERDTERVATLRDSYRAITRDEDQGRYIFIDESGSHIAMTRENARAPIGERAHGAAPYNWGDNITMIGALSSSSVLAMMTIPGSTDGEVFVAFIEQVLAPKLK